MTNEMVTGKFEAAKLTVERLCGPNLQQLKMEAPKFFNAKTSKAREKLKRKNTDSIYKVLFNDCELVANNDAEALEFITSNSEYITKLVSLFGPYLPALLAYKDKGGEEVYLYTDLISRAGVRVPWEYFAEILPITKKVIKETDNVELKMLYMFEYGIEDYLENVTEVSKDAYGTIITAKIEGNTHTLIKWRCGTEQTNPKRLKEYKKQAGRLDENNHRYYYEEIPSEWRNRSAKEYTEWSFGYDIIGKKLPDGGWDSEA